MNDKCITIYNYHEATEVWQRTILSGVEYSFKNEKTVSSSGQIIFTRFLTVTIPVEAKASNERKYISYKEYQKLEDTLGHWTLNPSGNKEIIVCGICDKEITEDYKITTLKSDFEKAGVICAVNDNTDKRLLRHYKVVCK